MKPNKPNRATEAIAAQHKLMGDDRAAWAIVRAAAQSGDLAAYHETYAAYLEQRGVISEGRRFLIEMARKTAEALRRRET